jgi:hypothetical protein
MMWCSCGEASNTSSAATVTSMSEGSSARWLAPNSHIRAAKARPPAAVAASVGPRAAYARRGRPSVVSSANRRCASRPCGESRQAVAASTSRRTSWGRSMASYWAIEPPVEMPRYTGSGLAVDDIDGEVPGHGLEHLELEPSSQPGGVGVLGAQSGQDDQRRARSDRQVRQAAIECAFAHRLATTSAATGPDRARRPDSRVRSSVHPKHVVRMPPPQRDHHPDDPGGELGGRNGR